MPAAARGRAGLTHAEGIIPDAITGSLTGLDSLVARSSLAASRYADHSSDLKALAVNADVDLVSGKPPTAIEWKLVAV